MIFVFLLVIAFKDMQKQLVSRCDQEEYLRANKEIFHLALPCSFMLVGRKNYTPVCMFQCFSYILDRVYQNSPSMHFRRANRDSGAPIRIQEGQYGFSRANTEPSVHFRKANTELSVHFRRVNTETY